QLTIRLADEYQGSLGKIAKQLGLKRSDIIRIAIRKFIEENLSQDNVAPYQKVSHLVGSAESGVKNLGQKHREHLISKIRETSSCNKS
ncbi:MAG: ribbon-helix-helix protein, CopG family, partial [Pseudomonadota bacterium]